MRKYEGVIVFNPNVDETTRQGVFNRLTDVIEADGKLGEVSEWGMKRLAYEVDFFKEGYYYIVEFEAETHVVQELTRISQITDGILRYMFTKLED